MNPVSYQEALKYQKERSEKAMREIAAMPLMSPEEGKKDYLRIRALLDLEDDRRGSRG